LEPTADVGDWNGWFWLLLLSLGAASLDLVENTPKKSSSTSTGGGAGLVAGGDGGGCCWTDGGGGC